MVDQMGLIQDMVGIVILAVIISFIPSIIYMIILRYSEKYDRESWRDLISSFVWGATVAIVAVILIRGAFIVEFKSEFPETYQYIAVIVVTPIAAEFIKPLGLFFMRDAITESEDGLIHGGTIGLGFAATENLLYGIFLFMTFGFKFFVITMAVRSLSVVLLNCTTTALTCYGISRFSARTHSVRSWYFFPFFYLAAVGISATFNGLAFMGEDIFGAATVASYSISLIFAVALSVVLIVFIYIKIYRLDRTEERERKKEEKEGRAASEQGRGPPPSRGAASPPSRGYQSNVRSQQMSRSRPPPRPREPPRQQHRTPPPRQQSRSLGPQQQARQQARSTPSRSQRPGPVSQQRAQSLSSRSKAAPSRQQRAQPAAQRTKARSGRKASFELEDDDEVEFSSKRSVKKGKRATFDMDDDEVEFTSKRSSKRSPGRSSGKKKSKATFEMDDDDDFDDDWL